MEVAIVAIIVAVGAASVSLMHTIKTSQCGCCTLNTRTPPQSPNIQISTPISTRREEKQQLDFLQSNDV
jgi:hypothetical protein